MKDNLLDQYKIYVEMADRISDRRTRTNGFYTTLLSGLLIVVSLTVDRDNSLNNYQSIIFLAVGILGCLVCIIWWVNIRSYRQLNSAKFQVIHEMEEKLEYSAYKKEWEILGKGLDASKYFQLTRIEARVPVILSIPFVLLITYSMASLF